MKHSSVSAVVGLFAGYPSVLVGVGLLIFVFNPPMASTPVAERASRLSIAISPQNAAQVRQLARWGKGSAEQVVWSPDGKLLALASSWGVYLYDAQTLAVDRVVV